MTKFEHKFFEALNAPTEDREAMLSSLDQGTDPDEFDVDFDKPMGTDDPNSAVSKALSERETQMVNQIKEWVESMETFLQNLNGTENSIQTALASAEADTILDKMKQSEQRKIARVATEIAALAESFKGFLAQTGNASLKYV